jgi:hypothetical protein
MAWGMGRHKNRNITPHTIEELKAQVVQNSSESNTKLHLDQILPELREHVSPVGRTYGGNGREERGETFLKRYSSNTVPVDLYIV